MAYPAYDSFNRAAGYIELGSSTWFRAGGAIYISGAGTITGDGEGPFYVWDDNTVSASQYAQLEMAVLGSEAIGATVRSDPVGWTFYGYFGTSTSRYLIRTDTQLVSASGCSVGDILRLEAVGSVLTPKRNGVLDSGLGAQTDSNYGSGLLGIAAVFDWTYSTAGDNWEGGNLSTAPTLTAQQVDALIRLNWS